MVKLRECSHDDYDSVMALRKKFGMGTQDVSEWNNIWKYNPIYNEYNEKWPIGWVLEKAGLIVGYVGNTYIPYYYQNNRIIAAVGISLVVDKGYRGFVLPLLDQLVNQNQPHVFLVTTANFAASKRLEAFKCKRVPNYYAPIYWIINYRSFINKIINIKGSIPRFMGHPAAIALSLRDKLFNNNLVLKIERKLNKYNFFDEKFNDFWEKLKNKYSNKLLCIRDSLNLNWHFNRKINKKEILILTDEQNDLLLSYAIFCINYANPQGINKLELVDFQTIDNDYNILNQMISFAIREFRNSKLDILEVIGFDYGKRKVLESLHPYHRKIDHCPYYYKINKRKLPVLIDSPQIWDLCSYDGDASL